MWCGAVLVADNSGDGHLAGRAEPAGLVLLGQFGVKSLQHSLAHAAVLSEPGRSCQYEDVGGYDLFAQTRPRVAVAHVELHARLHVVIYHADRRASDVMSGERIEHLLGDESRARFVR